MVTYVQARSSAFAWLCLVVSGRLENPKDEQFRKKIMVFVEIDRCATDAIASVTGCQLGKRTMKFKDFGINAATFLNLETPISPFRLFLQKAPETTLKIYPRKNP